MKRRLVGIVNGYCVWLVDQNLEVYTKGLWGELVTIQGIRLGVDHFEQFLDNAKNLHIGWGRFPDGVEVIYIYDADDECFGYAINLNDIQCSEWGYAPFVKR